MRRFFIIGLLATAFAAVSTTAQGQATDPWVGTWKTNLAKSTYSPGPAPKTPVSLMLSPSGDTASHTAWTSTGSSVSSAPMARARSHECSVRSPIRNPSNIAAGMHCKAAGSQPKGQDGWCTTDADCKCKDMGATCVAAFCTFTRPCDAPNAGGCAAGGSSGTGGSGTGGSTGTAGTSGGAGASAPKAARAPASIPAAAPAARCSMPLSSWPGSKGRGA